MINKVHSLRPCELTTLTFNPVLLGLRGNYSAIRLLSHFGQRGAIPVRISLSLVLRPSFTPDTIRLGREENLE